MSSIWRVISPFFYGFLLAYILNIPCSSLRKCFAKSRNKFIVKRQRLLSIIAVLFIVVAIIIVSLLLIIPYLAKRLSHFIDNIPVYLESMTWNPFGWHISEEKILEQINIENFVQPVVNAGTAVIGGLITVVSAIYILFEKDRIKALIRRLLRVFASESVGSVVTEGFIRLNKYFRQYIRTQTIDGMIVGSLTAILLFALGSPYALVMGVVMLLVNYVPYVGSIVGTLAAIAVVAFTQGVTKGAIAAGAMLVIQFVDANIIQPRLMSESFKISPFLVIISIAVGGAVAGILGMVVAIPVAAVLKDIFGSVVDYYEQKKFGCHTIKEE